MVFNLHVFRDVAVKWLFFNDFDPHRKTLEIGVGRSQISLICTIFKGSLVGVPILFLVYFFNQNLACKKPPSRLDSDFFSR